MTKWEKPPRINLRIKLQFIRIHPLPLEIKLILARPNLPLTLITYSSSPRSWRCQLFRLKELPLSRVTDSSLSEALTRMIKTILLKSSTLKLSFSKSTKSYWKSKGKTTNWFAIIRSRKELCKRSKTSGPIWLCCKIKFLESKTKTFCMRFIIAMKTIFIRIYIRKCSLRFRTLLLSNPMEIFKKCSRLGHSPTPRRRREYFCQIRRMCLTLHRSTPNSRFLSSTQRTRTLLKTQNQIRSLKRVNNPKMTRWSLRGCWTSK